MLYASASIVVLCVPRVIVGWWLVLDSSIVEVGAVINVICSNTERRSMGRAVLEIMQVFSKIDNVVDENEATKVVPQNETRGERTTTISIFIFFG